MIDLNSIVGFDWDSGNERKSEDKHSVLKGDAEEVFLNQPLLMIPDPKHSDNEVRFHALGKTSANRLLHITFTLRNDNQLIRIISARDMHRKERAFYEKN